MSRNTAKPLIVHAIANFMTGGSSRLVVDLIERLGDLYAQEVLTSHNPKPPAYQGITIHEYSFSCSVESLVRYLSKVRPAFIHVHYWGDCDYAWYEKIFIAAGQVGCKVVENINTPVEPYVTESISRYVYVSEYVYRKFGGKPEKSTVVYPGSDFSLFQRDDASKAPDDCIGMVYRLEKDKLNLQAIDVFIKVARRRPQTKVLIVGGGSFLQPYREAVRCAGVEQSFVFTGYVPYVELPSLYDQMSIFVAPVWKESFGQVSPFAMSHGIPVVGYDIGALEEIIGRNDLLAPPGDSDRLADIIIDLLAKREKRIAIGRENQQRAREMFSLESMIEGYRKVYAAMMEELSAVPEKDRKRVAIFVHCFFPDHFYGTETYTLNLARNLRNMNYEPVIVTALFPGEKQTCNVINYYEYDGLPVYCIDKNYHPHRRLKDTYYQEEMRGVLEKVFDRIKPDIVHIAHIINHTAVLMEVADKRQIPMVATLTDFFGHCFNNKLQKGDGSMCLGPDSRRANCLECLHEARCKSGQATDIERLVVKYPWLAKLERFIGMLPGMDKVPFANIVADIVHRPDILAACYRNLNAAIVPTRFTRRMYEQNGLTVPIRQITFGVDLARTPKPPRPLGQPVRFGIIGQIDYHKGTDILLEAFCRLPRYSAELYIYGSESQAPAYCESLKTRADGYPVYFCGTFPQEKITDVLAGIDFIVIPSRWYENSPLMLLSALASHTPVIVSDVEGMTEFVQEGVNGYTFKLGDVQDLYRILQEIVKNPDQALQMTITTEYLKDSEMMTRETIQVYEEVINNKLS